jgi:hypothetical protein
MLSGTTIGSMGYRPHRESLQVVGLMEGDFRRTQVDHHLHH